MWCYYLLVFTFFIYSDKCIWPRNDIFVKLLRKQKGYIDSLEKTKLLVQKEVEPGIICSAEKCDSFFWFA